MTDKVELEVNLKKNDKVGSILLFLVDEADPEEKMNRLSIGKSGKSTFRVNRPSRTKLVWHIKGKPGGKIDLIVSHKNNKIGHIEPKRSEIPDDGEKQNSGRLLLIMGK